MHILAKNAYSKMHFWAKYALSTMHFWLKLQHFIVAKMLVAGCYDTVARLETFENFVVLGILAIDANIATGGTFAIGI